MTKTREGKLVVSAWVALDGVFDADSMPTWYLPFVSEERGALIRDEILACDAMLLGRTTYQMLAPYWSSLKQNEMGVADKINRVPKHVVSATMTSGDWGPTTVIATDVARAVAAWKRQAGGQIHVPGSATLVAALLTANLVDELRLLVHPVIMGTGKRLFRDGTAPTRLELSRTHTLPLGVVQLVYARPGS